ncbi:response regulator transcription factor [Kangiella spongicola]|uniref:DNA-binding response regulator n=1 Tax=Kangiella spongicola TaxID=796379 RepID=A0A318D842_9GAMM|nr:response regulator transcription factor [Kangiella spongicola]MBV34851.1 DNA-binding response regulator [Rickettsiales bacterium]PXF64085.1 DNA-binding response regulator [Kangiella spongicola]
MAYSVLLVEDHAELAATTGEFLELCGYIVDYANDGQTGLNLALENSYDALILDVMLPGMSGYDICRKVRQEAKSDIPILMLTARDQLQDKLEGFDTGADDYLIKPFDFEELNARLNSIIKRHKGDFSSKPLKIHDLELDLKTMTVTRAGKSLKLSPTGLQILKVLMRRSPELVTREEIERELWGDLVPDSDVLRSHLYNLRKVIDKPFDCALLQTVPSLGLKIIPPDNN